jgi:hypothetical protein
MTATLSALKQSLQSAKNALKTGQTDQALGSLVNAGLHGVTCLHLITSRQDVAANFDSWVEVALNIFWMSSHFPEEVVEALNDLAIKYIDKLVTAPDASTRLAIFLVNRVELEYSEKALERLGDIQALRSLIPITQGAKAAYKDALAALSLIQNGGACPELTPVSEFFLALVRNREIVFQVGGVSISSADVALEAVGELLKKAFKGNEHQFRSFLHRFGALHREVLVMASTNPASEEFKYARATGYAMMVLATGDTDQTQLVQLGLVFGGQARVVFRDLSKIMDKFPNMALSIVEGLMDHKFTAFGNPEDASAFLTTLFVREHQVDENFRPDPFLQWLDAPAVLSHRFNKIKQGRVIATTVATQFLMKIVGSQSVYDFEQRTQKFFDVLRHVAIVPQDGDSLALRTPQDKKAFEKAVFGADGFKIGHFEFSYPFNNMIGWDELKNGRNDRKFSFILRSALMVNAELKSGKLDGVATPCTALLKENRQTVKAAMGIEIAKANANGDAMNFFARQKLENMSRNPDLVVEILTSQVEKAAAPSEPPHGGGAAAAPPRRQHKKARSASSASERDDGATESDEDFND